MASTVKVCFVCLGNICRSPTAQGVFAHLVREAGLHDRFEIDSAGTAAYHAGESPDSRATATAADRGVPLTGPARQFVASDFDHFDTVVAMDASNHQALLGLTETAEQRDKLCMLRQFDPDSPAGADVPDPYYGGADGFVDVFEICMAGCRGLLQSLRTQHGL